MIGRASLQRGVSSRVLAPAPNWTAPAADRRLQYSGDRSARYFAGRADGLEVGPTAHVIAARI